jgi:hypothetical protein
MFIDAAQTYQFIILLPSEYAYRAARAWKPCRAGSLPDRSAAVVRPTRF